MLSRNRILVLLAAGGSLLLHLAALSASRSVHVGGGFLRVPTVETVTVVFDPSALSAEPKPDPDEFVIGEEEAEGYASHRAEGDRTAVSREAQTDQAPLSLDPVGRSIRSADLPTGPGPDPAAVVLEMPPVPLASRRPSLVLRPARDIAPPPPPVAPSDPTISRTIADGSIMTSPSLPKSPAASSPAPPRARQSLEVAPPEVAVVSGAEVRPAPPLPVAAGSQGGGADPAPMSDSEADAFSVIGSAYLVDGDLRVRCGRKVKSRRPKIGVAGVIDLMHSNVRVTLRVAIDATGKVTKVDVLKSSGSNEIDQPCRVSMYDWWFEPTKDASGRPVPDVFNFTIGYL